MMPFESLETRTFMSVSPVSTHVVTDRLAVQADLLKFKSDAINYTATLLADCQTLQADGLEKDATLSPLVVTLHHDVESMWKQLRADGLAESSKVLADQSTIVSELTKLASDKGNHSAVMADESQLRTDRIQLQSDEIAGLNTRLSTRETDYVKIFSDLSAISTAVDSDPNASAQLHSDVHTFITDRTNCLNTMESDITTVIAARTKLSADLTAME